MAQQHRSMGLTQLASETIKKLIEVPNERQMSYSSLQRELYIAILEGTLEFPGLSGEIDGGTAER